MEKELAIDKCTGCGNLLLDSTCRIYLIPSAKWRIGDCPMNTHIQHVFQIEKKLNPLKASKKKMGK